MQRLIDAVLFQFGVDGLGEAGFGEADGLGAFDVEKSFKVGGGEMLHDGVMGEIFQDFFAAGFGDVFGDEHEVELALVGAQGVAADEQGTGLLDEGEEAFDRMGRGWLVGFAHGRERILELKFKKRPSSPAIAAAAAPPRRGGNARSVWANGRLSFVRFIQKFERYCLERAFSLTPALSRWERGKRSQRFCKFKLTFCSFGFGVHFEPPYVGCYEIRVRRF
jgi:hypothetical protein